MKKVYLTVIVFVIASVSVVYQIFLDLQHQIYILRQRESLSLTPSPKPTSIPLITFRNNDFEFKYETRVSYLPDVSVEETKLSYENIIKQYHSPKYPKPQKCFDDKPCLYKNLISENYYTVLGTNTTSFIVDNIAYLYLTHNHKNYLINLGLFMSDEIAIDQVISSFKFFPPINSFKTYVNTGLRYSFKYPSNYVFNSLSFEEGREQVGFCSSKDAFDRFSYPKQNELCFSIRVYPTKYNSLKSYLQNAQISDSSIQKNNVSWVNIGGQSIAKEIISQSDIYYFFNNGYIYTIDKNTNTSTQGGEFDQILSTFKFIQ